MLKTNKAITLITLIIIIIVLLILAGVTINMVLGENGLINKSKTSVAKHENAQGIEEQVLLDYQMKIGEIYGNRADLKIENCILTISKDGNVSISGVDDIKAFFVIKDNEFLTSVENSTYKLITPANQKVNVYVIVIDNKANLYKSNVVEYTQAEYEVTCYANGGNFEDNSTTKIINTENHKITLPTVAKTGTLLKGWYTDTTAGEIVGNAGNEYTATNHINLYARWYVSTANPIPSSNTDNHIINNGFYINYTSGSTKRFQMYAFDDNYSTIVSTQKTGSAAAGSWIGWDFETPVYVTSVNGKIRMKGYKIQYADKVDGTWLDAVSSTSACSGDGNDFSNTISNYINIGPHRYWRLYISNNSTSDSAWSAFVYELNFNVFK